MNKTILASALIGILATLTIIGAIKFTDENTYYCEARNMVVQCERLSSTGKTCYNPNGNRICYEGWARIENDLILKDNAIINPDGASETEDRTMPNNPLAIVNIQANGKVWTCQGNDKYSKCQSDRYEAYYGELN